MERDDATLKQASFHLQYEIGMVFETAYKLTDSSVNPKGDIVVYNALLESFMIHTRNLIYFFYNDPTYDDIVAAHFVFGWELLRGVKSLRLRNVEEEANKKVAHLTYRRFSDDTSWDIQAIVQELQVVLAKFCAQVDDLKVTSNFKQYISLLIQGSSGQQT